MNYWLNLFTGTTWDESRADGSRISGFRHRMRNTVAKLHPGDILLCYMTGVMRWVGALEVVGPTDDDRPIWSVADFPARVAVKPLIMLEAEYGVPMDQLAGRVCFYESEADAGKFKGFVRRSPNLMTPADGELVLEMLRQAEANPIERKVDEKKRQRKPLLKAEKRHGEKAVETLVTVPEGDDSDVAIAPSISEEPSPGLATEHTETEALLLELGADMGFDVWVARNDRGKICSGRSLESIPGMVNDLPTQFNEATNKTISLIDVLWLRGNSIVSAFEVECTTAIYSGLLRMSDLMALQPNLNIKLYIVAPDDRKDKVAQEILRPTFKLREPPICDVCGFISISELTSKVKGARDLGLVSSLKPEFLDEIAEYFEEETEG